MSAFTPTFKDPFGVHIVTDLENYLVRGFRHARRAKDFACAEATRAVRENRWLAPPKRTVMVVVTDRTGEQILYHRIVGEEQ